MVLLGFSVLKEKLLNGSKTQTIRKPRKHPIREGDKAYIYFGLRTKHCQKLGEGQILSVVRKKFFDLSDEDAVKDGFRDAFELRYTLLRLHDFHEAPKDAEFDVITWKWLSTSEDFRKN